MKSLEELKKLREQAQANLELRKQKDGYRVIVGMATCGIAAGARPVLAKFVEEVASRKLDSVTVTQVGCIGECALEPIVENYRDTLNILNDKSFEPNSPTSFGPIN